MPAITRPRGTNDLLPAEAPLRQWVLDTHARVAAAHGYEPIDTPVFEATELYERGTGAGTDVVEKEMFSFTDRGGRGLTLRPEGTPGVLRAVLAAHLDQERRPVRVHYAGPMFRYARPQAGRYHEFWQLGIEAIGERSPALDAEVIEVAWRFYEALGISGLSLQLNTLGDVDDRLRYRAALVEYYTPLRNRLCEDCQRRLEVNPLRLLDCKRDAGLVAGAPQIGPSLSSESQGFFSQVTDLLTAAAIPFSLNPRLVRGLDYYAHTTFELWHESLQGAQNAVGGGGRYDGLAEVLGFPPVPGSGYALGVERTMAVCREQGLGPAPRRDRVVVLGVSRTDAPTAAGVARRLRAAGIAAVLDASDRRLDRRLASAARQGARAVVLVGAEEAAAGSATWKDLDTGRQETAPVAEVATGLRHLLGAG
ncbi:MAG: histidine--tRNA ligase [Candidatus Dormibacteria bacterium]|jgi:histidyl-tRNA synthetase|nr:histidine--tRNA ligase [Chloroflexota bacterium]HBV94054.1 histidine--tRNA ligase [Chloroflexota bacterium]